MSKMKFRLAPVESTGDMEAAGRAAMFKNGNRGATSTDADMCYSAMLAASPGNDLLQRIVRALNTHAVNLKNDGFDQASNDVETLLNELGVGHVSGT